MKNKSLKADELIHEYNHFRSFGYSNHEIGVRLGYFNPAHMVSRLRRLGVDTDSAYVARARKVVDRLIDSGEPFTVEMLPTLAEPTLGGSLLSAAVRDGRVVEVGRLVSRRARRDALVWRGAAS